MYDLDKIKQDSTIIVEAVAETIIKLWKEHDVVFTEDEIKLIVEGFRAAGHAQIKRLM